MSSLALEGIRVLDLTVWRPGPYATQLLAEQGADVLKIEPPGGDPMRSMPDLFDILGANKRSVVLDLKDPSDRATAWALAADADVLVESNRPGVTERLGLGYEAVRAVNPKIVYCSVTGFGAVGPLAGLPGHDVNYLSYSGTLRPSGAEEARQPTVPISDLAGGVVAAFAIAAACVGALRKGTGERVDVSVTDVLATWVGPVGAVRMVGVDKPLAGTPGYGVFKTADEREVSIGIMNEDHFWKGLCAALDLPHGGLDRTERGARVHEVNRDIARAIRPLTQVDALARLEAHDVPASPVLDRAGMLEHPHFRSRGTVVVDESGVVRSGPIVRMEQAPAKPPYGAPGAGADRPEWLPR